MLESVAYVGIEVDPLKGTGCVRQDTHRSNSRYSRCWQKSETWADMEPPVSLDGFERGGRGSGDPLYRFLRGEVST